MTAQYWTGVDIVTAKLHMHGSVGVPAWVRVVVGAMFDVVRRRSCSSAQISTKLTA